VTENRVRVLVVFGGRSSEHEISCVSAAGVLRALDRERYDVRAAGILPDGRWVAASPDPDQLIAAPGQGLPRVHDSGEPAIVLPQPHGDSLDLRAAISDVDVVFPVLHGPWGEDGTIQGLLEMAGLPYVGSGVFASAAAMDKGHMKALLAQADLPIGDYVMLTPRDRMAVESWADRVAALPLPWFVKPARAGSSVGITRVTEPQQLPGAIAEARRWDPRVIVEAGIPDAREIECAVLVREGVPTASRCAEIRVRAGRDFYDYAAKYLDDAAELIVPADIPKDIEEDVRRLAVEAFDALDCEGLARVDFFVTDDRIVINEVNTMPGFTPISMYPRMWQASGVEYSELVDLLIEDALRKGVGLR